MKRRLVLWRPGEPIPDALPCARCRQPFSSHTPKQRLLVCPRSLGVIVTYDPLEERGTVRVAGEELRFKAHSSYLRAGARVLVAPDFFHRRAYRLKRHVA